MKKIIISSLLICIVLYVLERYFVPSYVLSTLLKIIGFVGVPLLIYRGFVRSKGATNMKIGWVLGCVALVAILVTYYLLRDLIDLSQIQQQLEKKNITATTYLFVAIYVTFGNSFLEEFFFRGFLFQGLLRFSRWVAYVFSSALFSIYHVMIFQDWFAPVIFWIAVVGLFVGGLLFCLIVEKAGSWKASWVFHVLADVAIVLVGFQVFGFFHL